MLSQYTVILLQVIEKVPQSKIRRKDAGRILSSSSSSRTRLAKKLHISPVTYRTPIPARALLTKGIKVAIGLIPAFKCPIMMIAITNRSAQPMASAGFWREDLQGTSKEHDGAHKQGSASYGQISGAWA